MQNWNISDALRYISIGYVSIGLLYVSDKGKAVELLENFGIIGISVFAFVIGSLIYIIYKPLIFHRIILPLQDIARKNTENCRTCFKKQYNLNTIQAMQFWFIIRGEFKTQHSFLEKEASLIHLAYMSSFISLFFAIWKFIDHHYDLAWIILIIGVLFGISAFLSHEFMEDFEYKLLCSFGSEKIEIIAEKFDLDKKNHEKN